MPSLLLASTLLALSALAACECPWQKSCPVADVSLKVNDPKFNVPSGVKAEYLGWAAGSSTYTCKNGKYQYGGEKSEMIDISCYAKDNIFSQSRENDNGNDDDVWRKEAEIRINIGSEGKVLGYMETDESGRSKYTFANDNGSGDVLSADWKSSVPAPGKNDADWQYQAVTSGNKAKYVHKVDTYGGKPPSSCSNEGERIQIRIVAKIVFYGDGSSAPPSNSPSSPPANAAKPGVLNAAAINGDNEASTFGKLLDYMPAILALLGASTMLSLVILVVGGVALWRRRRSAVPVRSADYRPIKLARSKEIEGDSYRDDPERYGA